MTAPVIIGDCTLYQGDCLEVMASWPECFTVDAVVTDPPYGIGADEAAEAAALQRIAAAGKSKAGRGWKYYGHSEWDRSRPDERIIKKLQSISTAQIVWGGNYFTDILPPTMRWLVWDKGQRDFSLADFEMAWCSEQKAGRLIQYPRARALQDGKEHPTQKPIAVMKWCLDLLPSAHTILDPFMGSGTTGVACAKMGRKFIGIELEPRYFDIACKRIEEAYAQPDLFVPAPERPEQIGLLDD